MFKSIVNWRETFLKGFMNFLRNLKKGLEFLSNFEYFFRFRDTYETLIYVSFCMRNLFCFYETVFSSDRETPESFLQDPVAGIFDLCNVLDPKTNNRIIHTAELRLCNNGFVHRNNNRWSLSIIYVLLSNESSSSSIFFSVSSS